MDGFPKPFLVAMVHLPALPGSPLQSQPMGTVIDGALRDAEEIQRAGFDAVMIENFGDSPFVSSSLEPAVIASLAIIVARVRDTIDVPIGVNALRNDARSALGIAVAAGADFIRVNVHIGVAATDQGFIEGRAPETLNDRRRLGADVSILADVHVKHAIPINQTNIALAAEETAYRGHADALIVSGSGTGRPTSLEELQEVKNAVPDRPILVGSGATSETISSILAIADGAIVGTSIKEHGRTLAQVDPQRAVAFIQAARG